MSEALPFSDESLSQLVAENIRAEAARRRVTQGAIARALGMTQTAVSGRFTGRTAWAIDEIQTVAKMIEMEPYELFLPPVRERAPRLSAVPRGGNSGYLVSEDSLLGRPPGTRTQNQRVIGQGSKGKFKGAIPYLHAV